MGIKHTVVNISVHSLVDQNVDDTFFRSVYAVGCPYECMGNKHIIVDISAH